MAEPVAVMWEVATDDTMRSIVRSGTVEADSRLAHSVHVEVGGLKPARPYWYRFTALGQQSPIGRARTAPAPNARPDRMRFAFASCSHYELGYFSAYRHMAAEDPDLVLFLGDYIYEYTVPAADADRTVRMHDGPTATDLVSYRNRYALYRTDPDLQALHASAPCLVTWDDHEVENDYANEWSQDMRVSSEDFLRRRAAAYQAFYEHMPLRARGVARGCSPHLREVSLRRPGNIFHPGRPRWLRSHARCSLPLPAVVLPPYASHALSGGAGISPPRSSADGRIGRRRVGGPYAQRRSASACGDFHLLKSADSLGAGGFLA